MKEKKKKGFGLVALLVLLVAGLAACIYFYPIWKSAKTLKERIDTGHFAYELNVELDRAGMEPGQIKILENLEKLTGFEEDALFCLTIRGSIWEDKIHALIYPKSASEPLMELYLSNDIDVINETLPFNTIRNNLTEKYEILNYLMPSERDAVYMTLEQVEQIFELDLSGIRDFTLPDSSGSRSGAGYFLLLAFSSKEKQERGTRYEIEMEQAWLEAEIIQPESGAEGGQAADAVRIRFELENPGELAGRNAEVLSHLGIELPVRELGMLKSLSAVIMPGEGEKPAAPEKFIDQEKVNLIIDIRDLIKKISQFFN